jgi:hypothetical protein
MQNDAVTQESALNAKAFTSPDPGLGGSVSCQCPVAPKVGAAIAAATSAVTAIPTLHRFDVRAQNEVFAEDTSTPPPPPPVLAAYRFSTC